MKATWILTTITIALILSIQMVEVGGSQQAAQAPDFTGRYIAAISDDDFLASTYGDGKLPTPTMGDKLSIVALPLNGKREAIAQIDASNSVTGAPYALALSPDNRTAFVVETLGSMPIGATRREQLPPGNQLVAIDLSNPRRPAVRSRIAVAPRPETVHVHPNGDFLAISTQTPDKEIILIPVQNNQLIRSADRILITTARNSA
jgi:hypothetical protein